MHQFEFLDELVIIGAMAIVVIILFQRLRLPAVIGLIATGMILGPSGLGVVVQGEVITTLAELGVTLLLFTIGLEFSIDDLRSMRRIVLGGGSLQLAITALLSGSLAALGLMLVGVEASFSTYVFIGLTVSLSSTAICAKILKDRNELNMPHGRAAISILLFQDIAVVPLMIVITLLDATSTSDPMEMLIRMGTFVGFGLLIALALRLILPRVVRLMSAIAAPEVLVLGALVMCFGAAYLTAQVGLSMALGAFMAGIIVAGTDQSRRIGNAVITMRDAFTSIFFISVGLLANISANYLVPTLVAAFFVVLLKAAVVTVVLVLLRTPLRLALLAGIVLAQIGEFSFVLAETGLQSGLINEDGFQAMLLIIIVTMTVAPLLITTAPRIVEHAIPKFRFAPLSPIKHGAKPKPSSGEAPDVVIIGYGVHGRNVGSVLEATQIAYRVLEMNGALVEEYRNAGVPIEYGDSTDPHDLNNVGIDRTQAVVIAISDQSALAMSTRTIRSMRSDVLIIARTRYASDAETIAAAGADVVVTEEYESSIQVFVTLLQQLGVDENVIEEQELLMRSDRYGVLGRLTMPAADEA